MAFNLLSQASCQIYHDTADHRSGSFGKAGFLACREIDFATMTPDEVDIMFVKESGFLIGEQAVLDT